MRNPVSYRIKSCGREEFERLEETEVYESEDSPTGYVVTFRCKKLEAEEMWVIGDWMFSDSFHSSCTNSARIWPHQWKPGCFPHTLLGLKNTPKELQNGTPGEEIQVEKFEFDQEVLKLGLYEMEKNTETGVFSCTIPLPSGIFNYQFVSELPDGNPLFMKTFPDPSPRQNPYRNEKNPESHKFSQVRIPFLAGSQGENREIEMLCKSCPGQVVYDRYETAEEFGAGKWQPLGIYLPYGYEPNPARPYPVLYLSHGGGEGEEAWMTKGGVPSILDHLIGKGRIAPMVVVTMNHEAFRWNTRHCIANLLAYLLPYVESRYAVSSDPQKRGFAGVSAGGFLAFELYEAAGEAFHAIGIWSGGRRFPADLSRDTLKNTEVHIGAGRYDDGYFSFGEPLERELVEMGLPFTSNTPNGGHQWSVWRKLLEDLLERVF